MFSTVTQPEEVASFTLLLLGQFDLTLKGDSVVTQIPRKAQALLALLALRHDRWETRADLAAALWPSSDPMNRMVNLRQQLSLLCRALRNEKWRIKKRSHALQLDLTGAFVDAFAFQENARAAEQTGDKSHLARAKELYRGPFMEGSKDTCFRAAREAFKRGYINVLLGLADTAVLRRHLELAVSYLREGLAIAPNHEPTVRFLMRLLTEMNEKDRARAVFVNLEQALRRVGKSDPEPETVALWKALQMPLTTHPVPVLPASSWPAPRSEPQKRRLPNPLSSLVGREQEMAFIRSRFYRHRLVTLVGPGGVGKTRLAIELAHNLRGNYQDGVAFADLTALPESRATLPILLKIADALKDLDLRETPGRPLRQVLADALEGQYLLLVIDNSEHVLPECAAIVKELLEACPALYVLATSREALRIPGEFVYAVPALSLPHREVPFHLEVFLHADAVRLFVERVQERLPDFEVTAQNASAIADICHALDGIPLALELAAGMMDVLTAEDMSRQLHSDYWILAGTGDRTRPDRYQTLRAAVAWSYQALLPEEKSLLHHISVLAGSWTLEAAHAVSQPETPPNQTLRLLSRLVHRSMVVSEIQGPGSRYHLLGTIRQYAGEQLADSGGSPVARERHAAYYRERAREIEPELTGGRQKEAFEALHAEQENLRAALQWAWETGNLVTGLEMAVALWRYWMNNAHFEEGLGWLTRFVRMSGNIPPELRQEAFNGAGNLAFTQGTYPAARRSYEKALKIAQQRDDPAACARIRANLGNVANAEGDNAAGRIHFEQSLSFFREVDDRRHIALALASLATVASREGNYAQACDFEREALVLGLDPQNKALALNNLSDTLLRMGKAEQVPPLLAESLRISREIGSRPDMLHSLYNCMSLAVRLDAQEHAAALIGMLEAFQQTYGVTLPETVRPEFTQLRLAVRKRLGANTFEAARAQGLTLPPEQLLLPLFRE